MVLMRLALAVVLSIFMYTNLALAAPPTNPLDRLGPGERERITQILNQVSKKSNMPNREVHSEFWAILGKRGNWSDKEIETLKDSLVGVSLIYMKYYWEDALSALEKRAPEKSSKRARYEERLLELRVLSPEIIKQNEENIAKIAYGQPLTTEGREYIITRQGIDLVLTSLTSASERVEKLFSREYKE
ncbi:MAG: hypothetical protein Q6354_06830 [Candidatus Brocadiales bacterium]|nr:hypothetical protein [Candidatus Brocadiales bacterium]